MNERLVADTLRTVSTDIEVGLPPVDAVVQAGQRRARNRRFAVVGAAAASVALVAGTVSLVADNGSDDSLPPDVVKTENPLSVPWAHDEVLHLDHVTVPAPRIALLVAAGEGAVVWADLDGQLTLVQSDGRSREIGELVRGSTKIAADTERGWVAWRDIRDDEAQVVVYDTRRERELGRIGLSDRTGDPPASYDGPLSVDGGYVYYASSDGDFRWQPGSDPQPFEGAGPFVDREHGTTLFWERGDDVVVITPDSGKALTYQLTAEVILSSDGRYLVGVDRQFGPGRGPTAYRVGAPDNPITFDLDDPLSVQGLHDYETSQVQSWSFTAPDRAFFVLLVARFKPGTTGNDPDDLEGAWAVVDCELPETRCRSIIEVPFTDDAPVPPILPLQSP